MWLTIIPVCKEIEIKEIKLVLYLKFEKHYPNI